MLPLYNFAQGALKLAPPMQRCMCYLNNFAKGYLSKKEKYKCIKEEGGTPDVHCSGNLKVWAKACVASTTQGGSLKLKACIADICVASLQMYLRFFSYASSSTLYPRQ